MNPLVNGLKQTSASLDAISKETSIDRQALQEILDGRDPTLNELRALAKFLKRPIRSFAVELDDQVRHSILFRKTFEARRADPDKLFELTEFVQLALQFLPPKTGISDWIELYVEEPNSYEAAEQFANRFRREFYQNNFFDPIPSLPQIVTDRCGVILHLLTKSRLEGASVISGCYPFIFVSPRFPGRMLFTLAHELGHVLAHHWRDPDTAILDSAAMVGGLRPYKDLKEEFVNTFASCLLMPQQGFALALRKVRELSKISFDEVGDVEILYLSRIFGVSFQAAARRCEQLDLLPKGGAFALYQRLKDEFGSPEKRADQLKLPKRIDIRFPIVSENLLKPIAHALEIGELSAGRASEVLNLPVDQLYKDRFGGLH